MTSESPLQLSFGDRNSAFLQSADDFRKQRVKVTRRIQRLKKYLNIQVKSTKNYKSVEITKDDYNSNEKYYLLAFLDAERDYLYALELKALIDLNSNGSKSKETLLKTRLKSAINSISKLIKISEDENNNDDLFVKRLELLIYKELVVAYHSITIKKWKNAIKAYSIARVGLQFLEQQNSNNLLYKDIIEEAIEDPFKLAIYRDSKNSTIDLTEYSKKIINESTSSEVHPIYKLISSKDADFLKPTVKSELVKEVNWRSYEAKVNDETTSKLLSKVLTIKLDNFENLDNAILLWQQILENHSSYIARTLQDDEEQDDQILLAYIKYNSLITRVTRDDSLLSKNKKESLRILDTIGSTIAEILELPGVYSDDELYTNLTNLATYYKSLKLNLISSHYFNIKEYTKSLLLSNTALESLSQINFTIELGDFISQSKLELLIAQIDSLKNNSHVLSQFESTLSKDKTVADDVNKFHNDFQKVVGLNIEAIPVKPVLFDVAYNYISYTKDQMYKQPEIRSTPEATTIDSPVSGTDVDEEGQKKKGFFGLFGR